MKTSLWVIVTLLTGIVGLLVGFSASSRLSASPVPAGGGAPTGTSGYAAPTHAAGGAAGYGGAGAHAAGGAAGYGGTGGAGGAAPGPSRDAASHQKDAVRTSGY